MPEPLNPEFAAVLAHAIVDTIRDPMLVLDRELTVTTGSRSFFTTFETGPEEVIGRRLDEILDGCFKLARLATLLEKVLPHHVAEENFEIDAVFPKIGRRILSVSAREVFFVANVHKAILLSFADETDRRLMEKERNALLSETKKIAEGKGSHAAGDAAPRFQQLTGHR